MKNGGGDKPVTQSEFTVMMTAIQKTLSQMQAEISGVKGEVAGIQGEMIGMREEIARGRRVQEAVLKTVQSIEGRISDFPTRAEHEALADRVFALEAKAH